MNYRHLFVIILCFGLLAGSLTSCKQAEPPSEESSESSNSESANSEVSSAESEASLSSDSSDISSSSRNAQSIGSSVSSSSENNAIPITSETSTDTVNTSSPNVDPRDFFFNGALSKEVLSNYLSRVVSHEGLLITGSCTSGDTVNPDFQEDLRMLINIGAKFVSRAAHFWSGSEDYTQFYATAKNMADTVHAADSTMILQGGIFEIIIKDDVNKVSIPASVFEAFGLPVENRCFNYDDMILMKDNWGTDCSVPDITKTETQMWYYYHACNYIDAGFEAIHLGQVELIGSKDSKHAAMASLIQKIRAYAATNARRGWVLLDGHTHGQADANGDLLYDFHTYPIGYTGSDSYKDGLYTFAPPTTYKQSSLAIPGHSLAGKNPNGFDMPNGNFFLLEADNCPWDGVSDYDAVTQLALLSQEQRNARVASTYNWCIANYPDQGYYMVPTKRCLQISVNVKYAPATGGWDSATFPTTTFKANTQSSACLTGFNLEETIKKLWAIN